MEKTKKGSSGREQCEKERHYEMYEMKLRQKEMRNQNKQSHQKKEREDTSLVTHSDNRKDLNTEEQLQHLDEKIHDLKKSILLTGDASTSESQDTHQEHINEARCFKSNESSKKMPNDKFPTDTNIDYIHLPNTHMDSKRFNSHRYNNNLEENPPSMPCQGSKTEEQHIHQNTSFQDDQYDDNLLYANEDTNLDENLDILNNTGTAAEKGLLCIICRDMILVCKREPNNNL